MKSQYEELFTRQMKLAGITGYDREYRFHATRKWRFDFAWTHHKVAVEIDGGGWLAHGGRHARDEDYVKRNEATLDGWQVLYFTGSQVKKGVAITVLSKALYMIGGEARTCAGAVRR